LKAPVRHFEKRSFKIAALIHIPATNE